MRVISSAVLAIWLVCLSYSSSKAVELEPLDKYLSKHSLDDPSSAGYVALRCSALYLWIANLLQNTRNDSQELSDQFFTDSQILVIASGKLMSINGGKSLTEQTEANIDLMVKLNQMYSEPSQEHYVATGQYITPVMKVDMDVCKEASYVIVNYFQ